MPKRLIAVLLLVMLLCSLTMPAFADISFTDKGNGKAGIKIGNDAVSADVNDATKAIVKEFKKALQFIVAICAMISFAAFAYQISKLVIYSGNEQGRARAIRAIVFAFIAVALFGGIEVVISLFWNLGS